MVAVGEVHDRDTQHRPAGLPPATQPRARSPASPPGSIGRQRSTTPRCPAFRRHQPAEEASHRARHRFRPRGARCAAYRVRQRGVDAVRAWLRRDAADAHLLLYYCCYPASEIGGDLGGHLEVLAVDELLADFALGGGVHRHLG